MVRDFPCCCDNGRVFIFRSQKIIIKIITKKILNMIMLIIFASMNIATIKNEKATIAKELQELSGSINQAMRTRIAADCATSLPTVNRYFAGKIGNVLLGRAIVNLSKRMLK